MPAAPAPSDDPRAAPPLAPAVERAWYLVAAVTYIAAGIAHKALLTWLVGPAWVVATLWFGPMVVEAVAGSARRRRPEP